jgi:hypothetical protein
VLTQLEDDPAMRALTSLAFACLLLLWPLLARSGEAQEHAGLVAINQCDQRLSLLVSAVSENGKRETYGWFNLAPNSNQTLLIAGGNVLMHKVALPFYIYATNADGKLTWEENDLPVQWQGKSYNMQKRDLQMVDGTGPFSFRAVSFAC